MGLILSLNNSIQSFNRAGFVGLLDQYTGAAAGYSLRRLSVNTTNVVRVRRSSDNAESDFTADEITDGTLLAWVGNTASDNGFVTTWYDQSGNSNDATQGTAANQPKIVDAGVLVEENGRPAVEFDGTDDSLLGASTITNEYVSIFTIFNTTKNFGTQYVAGVSNETTGKRRASWINTTNYYSSGFNANFLISSISTNTQYLGVNLFDNANDEINGAINGSLSTASSFTITPLSSPVIGIGNGGTFTEYTKGTIQEIIIFDSDQSSNRTNIETNINDHYNIYP